MTIKTKAQLDTQTDVTIFANNVGSINATDHNALLKDVLDSTHPDGNSDPYKAIKLATNTGWLSGGVISVNSGDNTKFDVSAGCGIIVDSVTDTEDVSITFVEWSDFTAQTPTYIATTGTSFLSINSSGAIVQSEDFPTNGNVRDKIQIGSLVHPDNATISGVSNFVTAPIFNMAATINDLQIAMGAINLEGNRYSGGSAANLTIQRTAGKMFYVGIQAKTNPTNPNNITTTAEDGATFILAWRDGVGGFNTTVDTEMTAGVYDDNNGGASAPTDSLTTNNWTNHRLYFSPDANVTVMQYGQTSYNSSASAIAAINTETFVGDPEFSGVPLRGILTVRGGASDLTDLGDAVFTDVNKYGIL